MKEQLLGDNIITMYTLAMDNTDVFKMRLQDAKDKHLDACVAYEKALREKNECLAAKNKAYDDYAHANSVCTNIYSIYKDCIDNSAKFKDGKFAETLVNQS